MAPDWLLVETLGAEPAVVAEGPQTKNLVPISSYLRRDPNLMAIQTAIGETVAGGKALSSLTPKHDRVIRTEVVQMTDGRIHGVHVWVGPLDADPPERLVPGPLKWDLTNGVATDTPESLVNSGRDPAAEATHGRAFAEDLPTRDLRPDEAKVLATAIKPQAGRTYCSTWGISDHEGNPINVGFVARVLVEADDDGREGLVCRAMNWRSVRTESTASSESTEPAAATESTEPAAAPGTDSRLIDTGEAQPGVYRALVDLQTWKLLKWLDDPCPLYDWRAREHGHVIVHPDDVGEMAAMSIAFDEGRAAGVLRLRALDGGWAPVHVTVQRVQIDDVYAGLLSLREPSDDDVAPAPRKVTRRARARAEKAARA